MRIGRIFAARWLGLLYIAPCMCTMGPITATSPRSLCATVLSSIESWCCRWLYNSSSRHATGQDYAWK